MFGKTKTRKKTRKKTHGNALGLDRKIVYKSQQKVERSHSDLVFLGPRRGLKGPPPQPSATHRTFLCITNLSRCRYRKENSD